MATKFDFANIVASEEKWTPVPAGAYVVVITGIEDDPRIKRFKVIFDIAEGPRAGAYANDQYDSSHRIWVKRDENDVSRLKWWLEKLNESNPGFDAFAAYNAFAGGKDENGNDLPDNPQMLQWFVGRTFGLSMLHKYTMWDKEKRQEVVSKYGRPDWENARICSANSARAGLAPVPEATEKNFPPVAPAQGAADAILF